MISGLLGQQTEDAYRKAKKILKHRFGNPFKVYEAYGQKLRAKNVSHSSRRTIFFTLLAP